MGQNEVSILPMKIADLEQISNNLIRDFDDFWSFNILKSELNTPNAKVFVLKYEEEIIGFTGIEIILDQADITNIVIRKDFRGKGLSNYLIKYLICFCKNNNIKKINLEVNSNNTVAINLYEKYGFTQVGCRKNYYPSGDGLLYTLLNQ